MDVPVDLLRAIDEGGNPDVFTAEIFERANRANQLSKGKAEAFASFRYPCGSSFSLSAPPLVLPDHRQSMSGLQLLAELGVAYQAPELPFHPWGLRLRVNTWSTAEPAVCPDLQPCCPHQSSLACRDSLLKGAESCYPSDAEAYKALLPAPKKKG